MEIVEKVAAEGDPELFLLDQIARGNPYVMVVAKFDEQGDLKLQLKAGGGIQDMATAEALLTRSVEAARAAQ